jgi:V8-like Glu-specific endopeptidase
VTFLVGLALASPITAAGPTVSQASVAPTAMLAASPVPTAGSASSSTLAAARASTQRWPVGTAQLRKRPFRGTVLVAVGGGTVCTGFVVARRKVVTAAHCLTRSPSTGDYRFRRGLPSGLRLYRGYSQVSGGSSFASCRVVRAWGHPRFIRSGARDGVYGDRDHDYAVLTVPASCRYPRDAVLPMWATSAGDGQLRTGRQTRLAGYPADPRFSGMNGLNLWRSQGRLLSSSDPALLSVTGFVAQGMSGAPVWRSFGSGSPCGRSQCVIGLITECVVNARGLCKMGDSPRRAVRITPQVKATIRDH